MSNDNWEGSGYDAEASTGNSGLYFRLKTKNQKVRLRLVSACYRFIDILEKEGEAPKPLKKCAWIAIIKEIVDGKPAKRVAVFQSGPMVYGLIKDLNESDAWGDPQEYDLEITRTEEQGKYYTVTPLPKPMGPISAEEKALVEEAAINLKEACTKKAGTAARSNEPNPDEHDPFADE